jgi:hypothetical protein
MNDTTTNDAVGSSWRRSSFCSSTTCIEVRADARGAVAVRDSKSESGPILRYSAEEWRAFVAGVKAGDFDDLC